MRNPCLASLCFAAVTVPALLAPAGVLQITGNAAGPDGSDPADVTSSGPQITDLAQVATPNVGGSQFLAFATFGRLRSLAGAESEDPGRAGWGAGGSVRWQDTFQIVPANPALVGRVGTLTTALGVAGSGGVLEAAPSDFWLGAASWQIDVFVSSTIDTDQSTLAGRWERQHVLPSHVHG